MIDYGQHQDLYTCLAWSTLNGAPIARPWNTVKCEPQDTMLEIFLYFLRTTVPPVLSLADIVRFNILPPTSHTKPSTEIPRNSRIFNLSDSSRYVRSLTRSRIVWYVRWHRAGGYLVWCLCEWNPACGWSPAPVDTLPCRTESRPPIVCPAREKVL